MHWAIVEHKTSFKKTCFALNFSAANDENIDKKITLLLHVFLLVTLLAFQPKSFQVNGDGSLELCEQGTTYENATCYPVYSYIYQSLLEQYWTLYGYGWGEEPPSATRIPDAIKRDKFMVGLKLLLAIFG